MSAAKKEKNTSDAFDALNTTTQTFKEGYEKFTQGAGEAADFQKANVEAWISSAGVVTSGVEKSVSAQTAFTKEYFESGVSAAKAVTSAGSVQEAIEIQSDFVRKSFENSLGHFTKTAELWTQVSKDASAPLTERYSEFVEKVETFRP